MAKEKKRERVAPWLNRVTLRRAGLGTALFAVLVAGIIGYHRIERFLIEDPRFALREPAVYGEISPNIAVRGIQNVSPERVTAVFAEDGGRSLYLFPLAERRDSLLGVDWVREASVARIWPDRVEVEIEERVPVAYVQLPPRSGGAALHVALIDDDGVILAKPAQMETDLPVLVGIREEQSEESRAVRVRRAMALVGEIGDLEERVSEIDVSEPANLKITANTGDQSVILELGRERFRDKFLSFLQHWPEIHRRLPDATQFDLRLDDRITALDGVMD